MYMHGLARPNIRSTVAVAFANTLKPVVAYTSTTIRRSTFDSEYCEFH